MNFEDELKQKVQETEKTVYEFLPEEEGFQKTILEAMNYSMKAGGKRLRPLIDGGDLPDVRRNRAR